MKHLFIIICCFFAFNFLLLAGENINSTKNYQTDTLSDGTVVYLNPDTIASFPGEDRKMWKFIEQNIKWPKEAEEWDITGKVILRMIIKENGEITNIETHRSLHKLFDNEAIRVVHLMPNFIPAKVNNKNVASYYIIPIHFRIQN